MHGRDMQGTLDGGGYTETGEMERTQQKHKTMSMIMETWCNSVTQTARLIRMGEQKVIGLRAGILVEPTAIYSGFS